MTTGTGQEPTRAQAEGLTDIEAGILDFERGWWKHPGRKEGAIREELDLSPTLYYAALNRVIDRPEALAYDPLLVRRLQRLRAARVAQRSARRAQG